MKRLLMIAASCIVMCIQAAAQKVSIGTDVLGYACLGTVNADVSVYVARKWSLTAGVRYNPFTFHKGNEEKQFQLRQQSFSAGARYWPWHTGSGWWFAAKLRYQEYNFGGIFDRQSREGDRFGAGMYLGYTHMLSPHFNIEFGLGAWTGMDAYRLYSCTFCGYVEEEGRRFFLLPDDVMVSLVYVF